ncbi:MAG TPA: hypothetical protein VHG08_15750 [Longimicrobium sp.]|nr:hypothetical protein [Longimicrobium sp.]
MPPLRYPLDELARLGDAIYDRDVAPNAMPVEGRQFVAIDVESGAYEIDGDELTAARRVLARNPDAQLWLRRVGWRYLHRV